MEAIDLVEKDPDELLRRASEEMALAAKSGDEAQAAEAANLAARTLARLQAFSPAPDEQTPSSIDGRWDRARECGHGQTVALCLQCGRRLCESCVGEGCCRHCRGPVRRDGDPGLGERPNPAMRGW